MIIISSVIISILSHFICKFVVSSTSINALQTSETIIESDYFDILNKYNKLVYYSTEARNRIPTYLP